MRTAQGCGKIQRGAEDCCSQVTWHVERVMEELRHNCDQALVVLAYRTCDFKGLGHWIARRSLGVVKWSIYALLTPPSLDYLALVYLGST